MSADREAPESRRTFPAMAIAAAACALSALAACGGGGSPPAPPALPPLHFRDATAASGIAMTITSGRTPATQILEVKGGGLALLDMDGDGDQDLFVPNGATLDAPAAGPGARLFENDGRGRFRDATAASGIAWRGWGSGVAAGDYDGDGKDDVFVAGFGRNLLLRNLGGGRFEDATDRAGVAGGGWCSAAAFGDLDGDGDLDLYVARYLRFDPASPPPKTSFMGVEVFAGPRGLPPEPDFVYENAGDGTFRDRTAAWGFGSSHPGYGLGVVILDFDHDGDQEVFVGNDSEADFLWVRGPDGVFEDRGLRSGIGVNEHGAGQATMGIAVGDADGNGFPDVFTTNFMNDTNTLHLNLGGLLFDDQTQRFGLGAVSRPYVGWAAAFADFDQDADEDLLVFNGHTYPEEVTGPRGWMHRQVPLLFERAGPRFEPVPAARGGAWLAEPRCGRSAVLGDLDGDGDLDVVAGEANGPVRVLENDGAGKGGWLQVALRDVRPDSRNRRGLGARVVLHDGPKRQARWIHAGGSYQAALPPVAHFGLGAAPGPFRLEVVWPDGHRQEIPEVAPDRVHTVERR